MKKLFIERLGEMKGQSDESRMHDLMTASLIALCKC